MKSRPVPQRGAPTGAVPIGEVARRFGLATHVLRHWEGEGLLAPERDAGGRRRYPTGEVYRVAAILRAKQAGLSLEQIRVLLATSDPAARRTVLTRHRDELRARIDELARHAELVEGALGCEHRDLTVCPRFREHLTRLVEGAAEPDAPHPPPLPAGG